MVIEPAPRHEAIRGLDGWLEPLAVGKAGAINAALLAGAILANKYPAVAAALDKFRAAQTAEVLDNPDPREAR